MKHQFFVYTKWSGGIYASTTTAGSRSGGSIAAAWAALKYLGKNGYLDIARHIMIARDHLLEEIDKIPELEVVGNPVMNIVAYTTKKNKPDLFVVADQLQQRGWMVDRQQFPHSIHLTIMTHNAPRIDEYLSDLKEAIQFALENPKATSKGEAALYGLMARIPVRGMVRKNIGEILLNQYRRTESSSNETSADFSANSMPEPKKWMGRLNRFLKGIESVKRWFR